MNDIMNDKKGHKIVNDRFTHKPDGLLTLRHIARALVVVPIT